MELRDRIQVAAAGAVLDAAWYTLADNRARTRDDAADRAYWAQQRNKYRRMIVAAAQLVELLLREEAGR